MLENICNTAKVKFTKYMHAMLTAQYHKMIVNS